jgi:hypothetical protein
MSERQRARTNADPQLADLVGLAVREFLSQHGYAVTRELADGVGGRPWLRYGRGWQAGRRGHDHRGARLAFRSRRVYRRSVCYSCVR